MKTTTRGFLKGLMAAFLAPVVAKNAKAEPEPPKIKLEEFYTEPEYKGYQLSGIMCCSGIVTGNYKSIFLGNNTVQIKNDE